MTAMLLTNSWIHAWYQQSDSRCDACDHGPKWHDSYDGCARENPSYCGCPRVYEPGAMGPGDYIPLSDDEETK